MAYSGGGPVVLLPPGSSRGGPAPPGKYKILGYFKLNYITVVLLSRLNELALIALNPTRLSELST